MKKKRIAKIKEQLKRGLTGALAIYMLLTSLMVFTPTTQTFALTGGPSQPEVQSFEPIGTSDMVDLFSGDMTYNIPLLDVEGYPINLSYSGGPSMDQEASWVGLGWNVNVGTINRALRGLPDDFNGDEVITETNLKKNWTLGVNANIGDIETFGKGTDKLSLPDGLSLNVNIGVNYNSYNGIGSEFGIGADLEGDVINSLSLTGSVGLGLNSSSTGGLDISPSLSLDRKNKETATHDRKLGGNIGASFNSRSGLSSLSIGVNLTVPSAGQKTNEKYTGGSQGVNGSFDLQQPTYTPTISNSMRSFALTARFKGISVEFFGVNAGLALTANYSEQEITEADKYKTTPAYGYLYSEEGQNNKNARHDYNRENEGSITPATPNLALTNYTYDVYSVSGQGVGGSYRPYRGQIGHVFSNSANNTSSSVPVTIELGTGSLFHGGTQIGVTTVNSTSGDWNYSDAGNNLAASKISFKNESSDPDFENVVFREANEMSVATDPNYYTKWGGDNPVKIELKENANFSVNALPKINGPGVPSTSIDDNFPKGRVKRNMTIQQLTIKEVKQGNGVMPFTPLTNAQNNAPDHHIGQIVSLGTDGMRYIYGQPAYNLTQKEVTFSVGNKLNGDQHPGDIDYNAGLVSYNPYVDNSANNEWGLDNYFQRVNTPQFAHSYLLSCVVSDDYVDVDGIHGPTDGDLGSYTKFSYTKIKDINNNPVNYKWRVPVQKDSASYNEGLKSDLNDDKASYLYGEKEIFYLDKIETKNFIAIFELADRQDAFGVLGENGGIDTDVPLKYLTKISLFVKKEYLANQATAVPLKEVHFVYDYELCENIPNHQNYNSLTGEGPGKLTLKKVFFTYRDSQKGKLNPYVFEYGNNYDYNLKAYDRWGCYKPNSAESGAYNESNLATFEFPYVDQNDPNTNQYVAAWTLKTIKLPSGGQIDLEFESDDYAYVQHKKAMEMVKIVAVEEEGSNGFPSISSYVPVDVSTDGPNGKENRAFYFIMDPTKSISDYVAGINTVYFRCLTEFNTGTKYDYVSGYAPSIIGSGEVIQGGIKYGWVKLEGVSLSDSDNDEYNPVALAGIQFGRLHLSKFINGGTPLAENSTIGLQLVTSFAQTFANFVEGFKNPNRVLYDKNIGTKIVLNKSWLRLNNVSSKKKGGGYRVKSVTMKDNWASQATGMSNSFYGQKYVYTKIENEKEISSGVASYEPQMGGDENPWKTAIPYSESKRWAPDERFYQETPIGESFFPSASVGYSKVEVMNLQYANVKKNATGKVVHEFYTARDFPTRVAKTDLEQIQHKSDPFELLSIFNTSKKDHYTGSQGFVIETNDMHGKPKSQSVYPENSNEPLTKVEYFYKQQALAITEPISAWDNFFNSVVESSSKLTNNVDVIFQNGTVSQKDIGVNFDLVADFNQSKGDIFSVSTNLNLDVIPAGIPFPIPTFWPKMSESKTRMQTATMTKIVQKFGVLETTRATDLGSVVETKNLAYDAETGQVLITETTTNFKDKVYSMSFPAYWHYNQMGPAYKNIGFETTQQITGGYFSSTQLSKYFVPGDEVSLKSGSTVTKAWVTEVTNDNKVYFQLANGNAPSSASYDIKVLRSGRRNMQSQMMASITTRTNPLHTFKNNLYSNVLQASAIEFTDEWRTYCDCDGNVATASTNPYFLGTRGNFRPKVSYLHLSDRTQSDYNNNTNIRNDGMFVSYTPYYKLVSGKWMVDRKDWTYTAEVTEFNPFGQELENKDALGRFSAATFGFNQTLAKAVAANARYREIGFTSFEDDNFSECADNHFKFDQNGLNRVSSDAHAGKHSVRVSPSNSARIKRDIAWCDQTGCETTINMTTQDGFKVITITGATGQSVLNYEVISGDPSIIPTATGFKVLLSGEFEIQFSTVDDKGCQAAETLTNTAN